MLLWMFEKIRKIFKSIGKLENKIIDNIINKTDKIEKQFVLKDYHFKKVLEKKYKPKNIS